MICNLSEEKIFIAGSKGMVGSALVRKLNDYFEIINKDKNSILSPDREELDLSDYESVNSWFKLNKPTITVIAAAKVGGILANTKKPADFILQNLKIQNNVIEAAWKNNVKRLLFLGSSCIYPKFSPQPIKEEYLLSNNLEKTNQWYAIAKIAGIKLCESLRIQYGFDAISLMPTNLYGPNDNYHPSESHVMASLIKKFIEAKDNNYPYVKCWGTGEPLREFLHVDDLAEAIIFCLEKWDPNSLEAPKDKDGNTLLYLNVASGEETTIKNLSQMIAKITNFNGDIIWDRNKPDGTPRKLLCPENLTKLGWQAKIKLKEGLKKTITEYKLTNKNYPLY